MTSDSPEPSSQTNLKELVAKLSELVQWIAELLVTRNWFSLLLLIDGVLILFLNPGGVVAKFLKEFFSLEVPKGYSAIFWPVVGLIFMAAIIIAVRTKRQGKDTAIDLRERKSIKGLRSFGFEDAEIFSRLQRNRNINECIETVTNDHFRFGILLGESGCGKTSFLQAGICPKLSSEEAIERAVYVRFTNLDPFEIVRKALADHLYLSKADIEGLDFLSLLQHSIESASRPLILFFAQFEQFFVYYKRKEQREPFVNALTQWYKSDIPVKIITSIRADLCDRLAELHQALGYSLGPQDVWRIGVN